MGFPFQGQERYNEAAIGVLAITGGRWACLEVGRAARELYTNRAAQDTMNMCACETLFAGKVINNINL